MGYIERKVGGGVLVMMAAVCAIGLVSAWPWLLGTYIVVHNGGAKNGTAYDLAGWIPEIIWLGFVAWLWIEYQRSKRRATAAAVERGIQHAARRVQMQRNNTPWHDELAGHIRHSTCTIKHRSIGAAARCSSRI